MDVKINEGLIGALVRFLDKATDVMESAKKKFEWEAEAIQRRIPVSDQEIAEERHLQDLEFKARMLKVRTELIEYEVRKTVAERSQSILRKKTHHHDTSKHTNHERKGNMDGKSAEQKQEGKLEGKTLTHNLGDKLKQSPTPS